MLPEQDDEGRRHLSRDSKPGGCIGCTSTGRQRPFLNIVEPFGQENTWHHPWTFYRRTSILPRRAQGGRGQHRLNATRSNRGISDESHVLAEIGRIITSSPSIEDVYARFAEIVKPLIPFDRMDIVSLDTERNELCAEFVHGLELDGTHTRRGHTTPFAGSIVEQVVTQRSGILFAPTGGIDVERDYHRFKTAYRAGVRSFMMVPLVSSGTVIGTLGFVSIRPSAYDEQHLRLAEQVGLQISGAVANSRLLREHIVAEEALRESEARYRTLIENMDARVTLKDTDGRYLVANQKVADDVGGPDGMIGKTVHELTLDLVKADFAASKDTEVIRTEKTVRYEESHSIDGVQKEFLTWKAPVKDKDERVFAIVTVSTDITDHQRSQEQVRRLARENELLAKIGRTVSSAPEIGKMFENLYDLLAKLLPLDSVGVNVLEPRGGLATIAVLQAKGVTLSWEKGVAYEVEGTFSQAVVREGRPMHFSTGSRAALSHRYPGSLPTFDAGLTSVIGAPLYSQGEPFGVLVLSSRKLNAYDDNHLGLIERVAAQISGPIANAQLYSQLRRAEESSRESAATYRALIENMDAAISLKDMDGRYVVVNQKFADQVGMSKGQIAGRTASEVYSRQIDIDRVEALDREVTQSAKPVECDGDGVQDDGKIFETRKAPVLDNEGNITGTVAISTDVTQMRAGEAELRSVHQRYRLLVDSLEEAVSMKDVSGRFLLVNKAFADLHGLPKKEIEGHLREEFYADSTIAEVARKQQEEILRTGNGIEDEITVDLGFGPRTQRVRHNPVFDSEGRIHLIVSSSWDITERKALESQLLQSQKMEAIGRLAGGVAHDFNNLLTAILGYAELGGRSQPDESRTGHMFREIAQVAERAATLTRQLLTFSRSQSGIAVAVGLNELVLDMDSMLRRLIGENIELVTLTAPEPLVIRADPGQMEQVLTNLVVNARDAMPGGGKLTIETADAGLGHARLTVSDTGVGMTDEVKQHIFEPFYTTKEVGEGSGLGLSTSYGIVTQSGGNIEVTSEQWQGSRFSVILPLADGVSRAASTSNSGARPGGDETILLVEDEPQILSMASQALRDLGYEVLEAANGVDALSVMMTHADDKIDLLLTDMVMPILGGRDTALRVTQTLPDIKVLYTSGFSGDALRDLGALAPKGHFLATPFTLASLASRVREALDR